MAVAIPLWIIYMMLIIILYVYPYSVSRTSVSVFLAAMLAATVFFIVSVVYTVREENVRHAAGETGLGPSGICAICANLIPVPIGIAVLIFQTVRLAKNLSQ